MRTIRFATLAIALALLGACATMSDVIREKPNGTAKSYSVPTAEAWRIAMTIFRWEGADSIEEHKDDGYMLTSSGQNLVSAGTLMGCWIEPDGNNSKVTIVTKRRIATNLATTLTETTFHRRFTQAMEILKSGQKLPANPPQLTPQ